jgi:hypothetical protein
MVPKVSGKIGHALACRKVTPLLVVSNAGHEIGKQLLGGLAAALQATDAL